MRIHFKLLLGITIGPIQYHKLCSCINIVEKKSFLILISTFDYFHENQKKNISNS